MSNLTLIFIFRRSGDGTVPYASLHYPIFWKKQGLKVDFVEIPNALHRDILEHPNFLEILSACATNSYNSQMSAPESESASSLDDQIPSYLKNIDFVDCSKKTFCPASNDLLM